MGRFVGSQNVELQKPEEREAQEQKPQFKNPAERYPPTRELIKQLHAEAAEARQSAFLEKGLTDDGSELSCDGPRAMQISSREGFASRLSTPILAAIILLAPFILVVLNGGAGETAVFGAVSGPILIGLMAQRVKGRTGVAWWLLGLIVMVVVNVLAGGGSSSEVLARTIMFGALPMVIIVATFPRRN
jgi:hypothetical protein